LHPYKKMYGISMNAILELNICLNNVIMVLHAILGTFLVCTSDD
jgi:hypothetical protein